MLGAGCSLVVLHLLLLLVSPRFTALFLLGYTLCGAILWNNIMTRTFAWPGACVCTPFL